MIRAAVFCKRDIRSFRVYVDIWELFRDLCHQRGIPASSYLEALMIRELDAMDKLDVSGHDPLTRWVAEWIARQACHVD